MAPRSRPSARTGTTCGTVPAVSSSPHVAVRSSTSGTDRDAVAERAETAWPAAWATAGSNARGEGVRASRSLKSDSAS